MNPMTYMIALFALALASLFIIEKVAGRPAALKVSYGYQAAGCCLMALSVLQ